MVITVVAEEMGIVFTAYLYCVFVDTQAISIQSDIQGPNLED
jgi:hypothetical protein